MTSVQIKSKKYRFAALTMASTLFVPCKSALIAAFFGRAAPPPASATTTPPMLDLGVRFSHVDCLPAQLFSMEAGDGCE
jgi:hypothetical protein